MGSLRSGIISSFSIQGFTLRSEALKYLQAKLDSSNETVWTGQIKKVLENISTQSLSSPLIEKSAVESAFACLETDENENNIEFVVHDSYSLPRYTFNIDTKKFQLWNSLFKNKVSCLHGDADSKADVYVERYKVIHQRTMRHHLFAAPAIQGDSQTNQNFSLKSVENLLGAAFKETNIIILGMLTQLKEGQFYLEDPTGAVKLNLSQAIYKGGLFTENNIVLAEGSFDDGIFYVTAMGFPPPEPASLTLSQFPNFHTLPHVTGNSNRFSFKLKQAEEANTDAMFVFLSDVWLDQLKVMEKLQILFAGYSQMPPTCFVLIGNFLSLPAVGSHTKNLEECFAKLANLISEFPTLTANSYFVFVPGPDDPGLPYIFPRPPIPSAHLGDFQKKVPHAVFTSNPCRIQYCTQDIVVFREDIISKMCRNSIYTPWEHEEKVDIPNLFVKTVIANGHLLPLPMNVAPIYWEFDNAFWLYPLPSVVVCADKYDPYTVSSTDSIFFNPGSLPRSNFSFKVYFPAMKQVEDSEISDDSLT